MKFKKQKEVIVSLSVLLVIILVFYYINMSNMKDEIATIENNLADAVSDYEAKILKLDTSLEEQNSFFSNMISNLREENKKGEKRLEDLIEKVESQSSIQLSELKTELKDINIKSKDFSAIVQDVLQSVVSVITDKGQGSGAFIAGDGYIVTNYHVVSGTNTVRVLTYENNIYSSKLIGYEPAIDIAVLKIEGDHSYLDFGDSDDVKIGEKVIALGSPGGLDFTVTEGIVSAKRKSSSGINFIQIDVPINPGNSGGPLVNIKSEIIGINEFKVKDFEGVGFAIASNQVDDVTNKIIEGYEQQE